MPSQASEYLAQSTKLAREAIDVVRARKSYKPHEILAVSFSFRILNSTVAINHLVEKNLIHDAKSILRTLAEAVILFTASLKRDDFMKLYSVEELKRRKKIFSKMTRGGVWGENRIDEEHLRIQSEITKELKVREGYSLEKLANDLDLKYEYYHIHNACSSEVHHLPHTMSEYIEMDFDNNRVSFFALPALQESSFVLWTTYDCVIRFVFRLNEHFCLGLDEKMEQLTSAANADYAEDLKLQKSDG